MAEKWTKIKELDDLQDLMDQRQEAFIKIENLKAEIDVINGALTEIMVSNDVKSTWGESHGRKWSVSRVLDSVSKTLNKTKLLQFIEPDDLASCYDEKPKKGYIAVKEIKTK
jgi:uncharacterized protein YfdQ (DUF2303 family)